MLFVLNIIHRIDWFSEPRLQGCTYNKNMYLGLHITDKNIVGKPQPFLDERQPDSTNLQHSTFTESVVRRDNENV